MDKMFTAKEMLDFTRKSIQERNEIASDVADSFFEDDMKNTMAYIREASLKGGFELLSDGITYYTSRGEYENGLDLMINKKRAGNIIEKLVTLGFKAWHGDTSGVFKVEWYDADEDA